MKKYTKVVLGLLVMTMILNPLLSFLSKDFSIVGGSFKFQNQLDSIYLKKRSADFSQKQSEAVIKLYKQNLESQIEQQLNKEFAGKDIKVKVDVNSDKNSDSYYEITKILLAINDQIKSVDKVDRISILQDNGNDAKKLHDNYRDIINKISEMYNISKDKIEISVDNNF